MEPLDDCLRHEEENINENVLARLLHDRRFPCCAGIDFAERSLTQTKVINRAGMPLRQPRAGLKFVPPKVFPVKQITYDAQGLNSSVNLPHRFVSLS